MEISRDTTVPVPQAAATVLMLRDGNLGLEAFLVRRHEKSNVHGGVYVFPGGKVDGDDFSYPAWHLDQDALALKGVERSGNRCAHGGRHLCGGHT